MRLGFLLLALAATVACAMATPADPPPPRPPAPSADGDSTATPAAGPTTDRDGCDWRQRVLPGDRDRVLVDLAALAARVPGNGRMPDYQQADLRAASDDALDQVRALLARAASPLPLGAIEGVWQVRSLQVGVDGAFDYPFFRARIEPDACGLRFAKVTGSQRRSGLLSPVAGDDARLAFLGTATVNDNPEGGYGPEQAPLGTPAGAEGLRPVNSAGQLLRIGPRELLLALDVQDDGFELYHLRR